MKNLLIGLFIGMALMLASNAFADDIKSLIGATIQGEFPVAINGNALEKKAVVINGSSYVPVRAIGDALRMDVSFDAELGIELKQKGISTVTEQVYATSNKKVYPVDIQIRMLDDQIKTANDQIKSYQRSISIEQQNGGTNTIGLADWAIKLDEYIAVLADLEDRKAALMAQ